MVKAVHVLAVLLVAVTMGLSLAHALELPGKLRLSKEAYLTVQRIYYPGFTFGGLVGELGGILVLAVLLFLVPFNAVRFWWLAAAFVLMLGVHLTYWLVTHPVNNFWLKDVDLSAMGGRFFSVFAGSTGGDWTRLRDIWEYSHVARAVLAMLSLIAVTTALAVN